MDGQPTTPIESTGEPAPRRGKWRRRLLRAATALLAGTVAFLLAALIRIPADNPAYPLTDAEAGEHLLAMRENPVGLERPVLILSGYRSPSTNADGLERAVLDATGADADMVASLSYPLADDINDAAAAAVRFVQDTWPSDNPDQTVEVDVIAISMGGLVARVAALGLDAIEPADGVPSPPERRLNVRTLYTFGSPHRGARLAQLVRIDEAARQMRPGSAFMTALNAVEPSHEIVPYAVLHDRWVGATRAAPPGQDPIWMQGRVVLSHHLMTYEPRLVADLARRLRGEEPLAQPSVPPRD